MLSNRARSPDRCGFRTARWFRDFCADPSLPGRFWLKNVRLSQKVEDVEVSFKCLSRTEEVGAQSSSGRPIICQNLLFGSHQPKNTRLVLLEHRFSIEHVDGDCDMCGLSATEVVDEILGVVGRRGDHSRELSAVFR